MEKTLWYILDGQTPVPCEDHVKFGKWFETSERHVAFSPVTNKVSVSTVFLGINHNWHPSGAPILFESAIFWGDSIEVVARYAEWNQALSGHQEILTKVKKSLRHRLRKRHKQTAKIQKGSCFCIKFKERSQL